MAHNNRPRRAHIAERPSERTPINRSSADNVALAGAPADPRDQSTDHMAGRPTARPGITGCGKARSGMDGVGRRARESQRASAMSSELALARPTSPPGAGDSRSDRVPHRRDAQNQGNAWRRISREGLARTRASAGRTRRGAGPCGRLSRRSGRGAPTGDRCESGLRVELTECILCEVHRVWAEGVPAGFVALSAAARASSIRPPCTRPSRPCARGPSAP